MRGQSGPGYFTQALAAHTIWGSYWCESLFSNHTLGIVDATNTAGWFLVPRTLVAHIRKTKKEKRLEKKVMSTKRDAK